MNDFEDERKEYSERFDWGRITRYPQMLTIGLGIVFLIGFFVGQQVDIDIWGKTEELTAKEDAAKDVKQNLVLPKKDETSSGELGFDSGPLQSLRTVLSRAGWMSEEKAKMYAAFLIAESERQGAIVPKEQRRVLFSSEDTNDSFLKLLTFTDRFGYFCASAEIDIAYCRLHIYNRQDNTWALATSTPISDDYYLSTPNKSHGHKYLAVVKYPDRIDIIDLFSNTVAENSIYEDNGNLGYPSDGIPNWVTSGEWIGEEAFEVKVYEPAAEIEGYRTGLEVPIDTFKVEIE